jgi:hypothetical protein
LVIFNYSLLGFEAELGIGRLHAPSNRNDTEVAQLKPEERMAKA